MGKKRELRARIAELQRENRKQGKWLRAYSLSDPFSPIPKELIQENIELLANARRIESLRYEARLYLSQRDDARRWSAAWKAAAVVVLLALAKWLYWDLGR